ncbi:hypothetical protein scyTo_0001908 [Scyliorhinus torazame]|uniref:Protein SPT2 homolog n=1 Tax=Scyliorhinus torazame TaxID=75743 RepID=A0A401PGM6_SCYTO|nr:hypothetical protein [Scyliorhinus torazame]
MDFSSVLNKATENRVDAQATKRYSLSVKPPKKCPQVKGVQSTAVQAFLKRKEEEVKNKDLEARRKKSELIAKRVALKHDRKARAMATRTKDNFRGYDGIPVEQKIKKKTSDDEEKDQIMGDSNDEDYYYAEAQAEDEISEVEDSDEFGEHWGERPVKQQHTEPEAPVKRLKRQHREPEIPTKEPKRLHKEHEIPTREPEELCREIKKTKVPKKPPSAPMNFTDLLKLAEKKQFEPVELKPVKKTEEKLYTAEELKEIEFLERKRQKQNDKRKSEREAFSSPTISSKKESSAKDRNSSAPAPGRPGSGVPKPKCTVVAETISSKNFPSRPSNGQMSNMRSAPPGYRPMARPSVPPARPPMPPISYKRRLEDDYDEDDYDSEMDDFIDDSGESQDEISKHIKDIFGYDRKKYKDESDYALRYMESSWKDQQKEEAKSLHLGIMEDAEELRKEEEELKRKKLKAKKQQL